MPNINTLYGVIKQLIIAAFINYCLKYFGVIDDMSYMVTHFVLWHLWYVDSWNKFTINLMKNPTLMTEKLLMQAINMRLDILTKKEKK